MIRSRGRRWIGASIVVLLAGGAAAVWTLPVSSRDEIDGPADPILDIRRPVLGLLRATGIVSRPSYFDLWLPTSSKEPGWDIEPVYRALVVRTGWRVARTVEVDEAEARDLAGIRLVSYRDDAVVVLDEDFRREAGTPPRTVRWRVHAFVPADVDGVRYEAIGVDGAVRWTSGWSRLQGDGRERSTRTL